jgi:glycosyltransferase involved in cell wall biosynthesis
VIGKGRNVMSINSSETGRDHPISGIALAFVGAVVPDEPRFRSSAFNPAGNNFQIQLIRGLQRQGVTDIEVLSARPIPSYPRSTTLWVSSQSERLGEIPLRLLSFPNVTPVKQIVVGMGVLIGLAYWGWRKRSSQHRVVLTYNLTMPPGMFTLLGARLARAKAVVSVNDINIPGQTVPASPLWRLDVWLQRFLLPRFDGHLAVADQIASDFFPGRPYVLVEGGVDNTFLEQTRRVSDPASTATSSFTFAFAGWLNEANGIGILLPAFLRLGSPKYRLRIAGTGPLRSAVEEASRQDTRIQFLGLVDAPGVANMYRTSDVLLNIRLTKSIDTRYFFPSKLIEFLAAGVPTITTSVAHVEDEFDGLVYVLHDETAEALAKLMSFVASKSDHERSTLGSRARAFAVSHKTWDVQAAKVARYLVQLVATSQR